MVRCDFSFVIFEDAKDYPDSPPWIRRRGPPLAVVRWLDVF